MSFKSLLKRPALIAFLVVLVLLILVVIRIHTYAWRWMAGEVQAKVPCEESGWHYALALDIIENMQSICWQHAEALLSAEKQFASGEEPQRILKDLSVLPGVKASIIGRIGEEIAQYPIGAYQVNDLKSQMAEYELEATGYVHPIMHRKVGGLTRFVKWRAGQDSLDIMVHYAKVPGAQTQVFGLIFDKKWVFDQIPALMDSLARESPLLLFWSKSPPDLAEQSIGVIYGADTLWWQGDRSLKAPVLQHSQLISDMNVHARYHYIAGEKEVADHMPGVRRWFASAEILGIAALALALFAIRARKQDAD